MSSGFSRLTFEKLSKTCNEILRQERTAILSRNFSALPTLAARKTEASEELMRRLNTIDRDRCREEAKERVAALLTILSRRATENMSLLRSAAGGMKEAQEELEKLKNSFHESRYYTPNGIKKIDTPRQRTPVTSHSAPDTPGGAK